MVGPIIPPSVIMVIYASVAQVSVIKLFLAGFVPGLLQGAGLRGHRLHLRAAGTSAEAELRTEARRALPLARDGVLVFSLPVMIVSGR